MTNVTVQEQLRNMLEAAFSPLHLTISDDSHRHAGHAGARPEGETHFRVTIVSHAFDGQSRVARQRMVYSAVDTLLKTRIHALQLTTLSPAEHDAT